MQEPPVQQLQFRAGSVAFDPVALDSAVKAHGIRFIHYSCAWNPVGLIDKNDSRRPDVEGDFDSINGMVYVKVGHFRALLLGNTKETRAMEGGLLNSARAQLTPQRFYESENHQEQERVYLSPFDRLYLDNPSILVIRHELATAHETGVDRLNFPVAKVQFIIDSNGIHYSPDDYQIEEGCIRWVGKRPGVNPNTGKGVVYSIKYLYQPHWYVDRMLHELRTAQQDGLNGKSTILLPQSCIVNREFVYLSKQKNPDKPDQQSIEAPADGGVSPK